jgi:two-component system phosphate regulon sensor histidine kinase PhoR
MKAARRKRSLVARALPAPAVVTGLVAAVAFSLAAVAMRQSRYADLERSLMESAKAVAGMIAIHLDTLGRETGGSSEPSASAAAFARALSLGEAGFVPAWRVTVIDTAGRPLFDSRYDASEMENHGSRPEFRAALSGRIGSDLRRSRTLEIDTMYAASPIVPGSAGRPVAAARIAVDVPSIEREMLPWTAAFAALALLSVAVAAFFAVSFAREVSSPIAALAKAARDGSMIPAMDDSVPSEIRALADSLRERTESLGTQAARAERGKAELEAVLEAIGAPVLTVDETTSVSRANSAAAELSKARSGIADPVGKSLLECFRSTALAALASRALGTGERMDEEEIELGASRAMLAVAGPVHPTRSIVLVLHDVSAQRKLETVRRDFVANVSHELRTPITIASGYAEELADLLAEDDSLARSDGNEPELERKRKERVRKAVAGIGLSSSRLAAIVRDLLTLSSLESGARIDVGKADIGSLLERSREQAAMLAERRGDRGRAIGLIVEEGLSTAHLNEGLIEQALVNLLDNALKYSPPGSPVSLSARVEGAYVAFSVRDRGAGIPAEELPRVFERFYRVGGKRDGGSGLGLSIVRHVAAAHGGRVDAVSDLGVGSTFSIVLPLIP